MRVCDCKKFKERVEDKGLLIHAQDWTYCTFCGKKMKEKITKSGR